jgi:aminopeptidase
MSNDLSPSIDRYAELIVKVALNLRPGQRLLVGSPRRYVPLATAPFVRRVARHAYQAGARYVEVLWGDDELTRLRLEHAPRDSFGEGSPWRGQVGLEYAQQGDALISVSAEDPALLQDPALVSQMQQITLQANKAIADYHAAKPLNGTVASVPTPGWAAKVFSLPGEEARLAGHPGRLPGRPARPGGRLAGTHPADPGARRNPDREAVHGPALPRPRHRPERGSTGRARLGRRAVHQSQRHPLHPKFPNRRDLQPAAPRAGGGPRDDDQAFRACRARHRKVHADLCHRAVVQVTADQGEEALRRLIETDEGAAHLGEVALVPDSSPISRSGILFYNTLFDENAADHIALGRAYKQCMQGGPQMSDETFAAAGGNLSLTHNDFMIGSAEMDVDGVKEDGSREPVMRQGEWAFAISP